METKHLKKDDTSLTVIYLIPLIKNAEFVILSQTITQGIATLGIFFHGGTEHSFLNYTIYKATLEKE